jgi:hypothetical protein
LFSQVRWTERHQRGSGDNRRTETVVYHSEETYLRLETILAPGPSLPAGTHYLPISLALPPGLPGTFEAVHGHVRYYLKATWVRDWKWDYDVKQLINVLTELDLNMFPMAAEGGQSQDHKTLCCLCCK